MPPVHSAGCRKGVRVLGLVMRFIQAFLWNPAVFVATLGVLLAVPAAISVLSAGRMSRLVVSRCHDIPLPLPEGLPAPAGVYRLVSAGRRHPDAIELAGYHCRVQGFLPLGGGFQSCRTLAGAQAAGQGVLVAVWPDDMAHGLASEARLLAMSTTGWRHRLSVWPVSVIDRPIRRSTRRAWLRALKAGRADMLATAPHGDYRMLDPAGTPWERDLETPVNEN